MNKKLLLLCFIFNFNNFLPLSGMTHYCTNHKEKVLSQPRTYFSRESGTNGITSNGTFIFSRPYNSKIATCFAGEFSKGLSKSLDKNPLSIINLSTSTQDGYTFKNIDNRTPVSCIHLLNDKTMAIGHGKKIYIAQDNGSRLIYFINNFFAYPRQPRKLSKVLELSPQLGVEDSIATIESSLSHLIVISKKGHISTWQKVNNVIQESSFKTFDHTSPFFSYAVNQEKNILCMGLDHGKIFTANIANLNKHTITHSLDAALKINCMNFQNNTLFASALCDCHQILPTTKNSNRCNNKHVLLSFEECNQAENTLPKMTGKETLLSFPELCPKKAVLLPNGLFVSHTALCNKNVSDLEEDEIIKEVIAVHSPDNIQNLLTIDTTCMRAIEYPVHPIITGNEIHMLGEIRNDFSNYMIYFHRIYTPNKFGIIAKYAYYTQLMNYINKRSYFSVTMHFLIPALLLYAASRYFSD